MRNVIVAASLALAALPCVAGATVIDEVYAFGDSLNDCCINPQAPFLNGDESWLVDFASAIGASYTESTTNNYATGGAQSGSFNAIAPGGATAPDGLRSQIGRFQADAPSISSDDLAVIWVGTNDIWASSYQSDTLFGLPGLDIVKPRGQDPSVQSLSGYIARNIQNSVKDLRDAGFGNVLLLTPYDMGDSALVDTAEGPAQNTAYSEALRDKLMALATPGVNTYALDIVELIRGLQAGSPDNGFLELTTSPSCTFGEIVCETRPLAEQDSFVYYDFVHLTAATNREISAAAASLILDGAPVAPVPLPAGVWLLGAGLGMMGLLRRRRRAAAN